nr:proton-conducting transporter membrane subunit [Roseomonas acroporae]
MPRLRHAAAVNCAVSAATLLLALWAAASPYAADGVLHTDALNLPLLLVAAVVGASTSVYSAAYVATLGYDAARVRVYHAAFQGFMGAVMLALLADNLGVTWVAIEAATLASVMIVALPRTAGAIAAAWKLFILCGVGIGLALFGTVVLYLAGQPFTGGGMKGLSWAALRAAAPLADPGVLNLAFVFLLVGYGTKAGLVPLHSWLPDAESEGPTPITAVLSGLLLNAALHAVLRAKAVVGANPGAIPPGTLLLALGLASVLLAALSLSRRRDARRFFAWSSIEHMGLAAFAFGLGGAASLAGLVHMAGHSLLKSAVFFGVGRAAQRKGSQRIDAIGGLVVNHPALGWALAAAIAGLAGLPPFALFASEFALLTDAAARAPLAVAVLALGLVVAFAALVGILQSLCLGTPTPEPAAPTANRAAGGPRTDWATVGPMLLHLLLALGLGVALPEAAGAVLRAGAALAG